VEALGAAGVVNEDVEAVGLRFRPGDELVYTLCLRHVERVNVSGVRTGFLCFGGYGFESINTPRAEHQFGAFSRERARGRGAETAGGAGDEDPFVGKRGWHDEIFNGTGQRKPRAKEG